MLIASLYAMCSAQNRAARSVHPSDSSIRHSLLYDDCAMIGVFVTKWIGAPENFHAVGECLLLRFNLESGQKRWMNVQNSSRELLHKPGEADACIQARQTNSHYAASSAADNFAVMFLAGLTFGWMTVRQARAAARWQYRGQRFYHMTQQYAHQECGPHQCCQRWATKVRAAARKEEAEGFQLAVKTS